MTVKFTIRLLEPRDVPDVRTVISHTLGKRTAEMAHVDLNEAFGPGAWRPTFYVAEMEATRGIVGVAAYNTTWLAYGTYALSWVNVDPWVQGCGIGTSLVKRCLRDLRPIARLVLLTTETEADWYAKHFGFVALKQQPGENDQTETLMALDIREGTAAG